MASPVESALAITIANYVKGSWDSVAQHSPVLDFIKKKGTIKTNVAGTHVEWATEGGRFVSRVVAPFQDISDGFVPRKRFARASLPFGEALTQTAIDKRTLSANQGEQALAEIVMTEAPGLLRDLMYGGTGGTTSLSAQFLQQDGSTYAGVGQIMYGLPSALKGSGFASLKGFNPATKASTGSNVAAADKEAHAPSGTTYAGLDLSPGALPVEQAEYDAWMPTLVNTSSNAWTSATLTFRANCFEILNHAISRASRFNQNDPSMNPDAGILTFSAFQDLTHNLAAKQSFFLTDKVGPEMSFGLGGNTKQAYHNGLPFYWDNNMPSASTDVGYILNFSQVYWDVRPIIAPISGDRNPLKGGKVDRDAMVETEVAYNDSRRALTVSLTHPGQFRFNPRYQVRLAAYA